MRRYSVLPLLALLVWALSAAAGCGGGGGENKTDGDIQEEEQIVEEDGDEEKIEETDDAEPVEEEAQTCQGAEKKCDGLKIVECQNGYWVELSECSSSQFCRDAQCHDRICSPDNKICDGDFAYKTCLSDGSDYSAPTNCQSGEYCEGGKCEKQTCKPGDKKCEGNAVATCNVKGSDYDIVWCETTQYCDEAECKTKACEPASKICDGETAYRVCNETGSGYGDAQQCEMGKTCVGGECLTIDGDEEEAEPDETGDDADEGEDETGDEVEQDLEPVCADWTKKCDGKTVMLCENGQWKTLLDCPDLKYCKDGECFDWVCSPEYKICDGDFAFKTCKLDGSGYGDAESCGSGKFCLNGDCQNQICAPGEKKCYSTTSVLTCNKQGSDYLDPEVCPNGKYCNEGACADYACQPNSVVCDGDFAYKFCKPDGSGYSTPVTCPSNQYCSAGACAAQICAPKSKKCDGNGVATCNDKGSAYGATVPCGAGEFCDAGACIAVDGDEEQSEITEITDEQPEEETEPELDEEEIEPEDKTPPTVSNSSPMHGETGVSVKVYTIIVNFSELMTFDAETWNNVKFHKSGCVLPDCEIGFLGRTHREFYAQNYTQYELSIDVLEYSTTYELRLSSGLKDLAGNPLADTSILFTTQSAPVDGDPEIEETAEEADEYDAEPEEEIAGGTISGSIWAGNLYVHDFMQVQLFNAPPVDISVTPFKKIDNNSYYPSYQFTDLPNGKYWVRVWFDNDGDRTINPLYEWAFAAYAPLTIDLSNPNKITYTADVYMDYDNQSLGELSGSIDVPPSLFGLTQRIYVEAYREDPSLGLTAPIARVNAKDPSVSYSRYFFKIRNLVAGSYWLKAFYDVCNEANSGNDYAVTPQDVQPFALDPFNGVPWVQNIQFHFPSDDAMICPSDGDVADNEPEIELENEYTACSSDSGCVQPNVCHIDANGKTGDCALPCTSDLFCTSRYGGTFFCAESDQRCHAPTILPAQIPDDSTAGLSAFIYKGDSASIQSKVCLTVDITHPNVGQLRISLEHPAGYMSDLYFHDYQGLVDLVKTFSTEDFMSLTRKGYWKIHVYDDYAGGTGQLNSISLAFDSDCAGGDPDETEIEASEELPEEEPELSRAGTCGNPYSLIVDANGDADTLLERTTQLGDSVNPTACSGLAANAAPGVENVYAIDIEAGWTLTATFEFVDFDAVLYIMYPCENSPSTCMGANANGAGEPETLIYTLTTSGQFYLVVDGAAGATGNYYLKVHVDIPSK